MKSNTARNGIVLAVLLIGILGAWKLRTPDNSLSDLTETFTAQRGPLRITLKEKGNLRSKNSEKITCELKRGGKIVWLIDEGTIVEAGDELIKFETKTIEDQIENRTDQLAKFEADLNIIETNLDVANADAEQKIMQTAHNLEIKKNELEKYINGSRLMDRRKHELAVSQSESKMKRVRENYEQMNELLEEGFFTTNEVEEERIKAETAATDYESAVMEREMFYKYTEPQDLKQKQIAVEGAKTSLNSTTKSWGSNIAGREGDVKNKLKQIKDAKEELVELAAELSLCVVLSPRSGIVLHGDPERPNTRDSISIGGTIWATHTVLTIPDVTEMVVDYFVHEVDIGKITTGMKTFITCETYPGESFSGKVEHIATVAETGNRWWERGQSKQFKVESSMTSPGMELKPGITAKVEVLIEELTDVLFVPAQCIFIENGEFFCYKKTASGFQKTKVKPGHSNEQHVVIESGIKEGDQIALYQVVSSGVNKQSKKAEEKEKSKEKKPAREKKPAKKPGKGRNRQ